jgi:hypothetical protein
MSREVETLRACFASGSCGDSDSRLRDGDFSACDVLQSTLNRLVTRRNDRHHFAYMRMQHFFPARVLRDKLHKQPPL